MKLFSYCWCTGLAVKFEVEWCCCPSGCSPPRSGPAASCSCHPNQTLREHWSQFSRSLSQASQLLKFYNQKYKNNVFFHRWQCELELRRSVKLNIILLVIWDKMFVFSPKNWFNVFMICLMSNNQKIIGFDNNSIKFICITWLISYYFR